MIYVDLDGVIFNFHKSAFSCFNKEYKEEEYPKGVERIEKVLGINTKEFWRVIDHHGVAFWAFLETYDWWLDLIGGVEEKCKALNTDWRFLSSPSRNPSCAMGKLESVQRLFGVDFRKYVLAPSSDKQLLCRSERDFLIDDKESNIDEWNAAGGVGILFPQPWNRHFNFTNDRINFVLDKIKVN